MSEEQEKKSFKMKFGNFFRMVGSNTQDIENIDIDDLRRISQQNSEEIMINNYVSRNREFPVGEDEVSNVFHSISSSIGSKKKRNKFIKQIAPEIKQAEKIIVPSILSPTEMQCDEINFVLEAIGTEREEFSDVKNDIEKIVSKFFNDDFELGNKLSSWLSSCIFKSGSKPILIFPGTILSRLNETGRVEVDNEEFSERNLEKNKDKFLAKLFPENKDTESLSFEDFSVENEFPSDIRKVTFESNKGIYEKTMKENIYFSSYPEYLAAMGEIQKREKNNKDSEIKKRIFKDGAFRYKENRLVELIEEKDDGENLAHPIFMELPAESVIPVIVPGSPEEHLGYFVMIDENGHPLTDVSEYDENFKNIEKSLTKDAKKAFGDNKIAQAYFTHSRNFTGVGSDATTVSNKIFDSVLEKYMRTHMNSLGEAGFSSDTLNSINKCMLMRLLKRQKTSFVYVPKEFLIYYAFEYDEETGTGKSKLDDIEYILSIRVTLLVAFIMSSIKAAIDKKRIKVEVPKQVQDKLGYLQNITNQVTKSSKVLGNLNPSNIEDSMIRRSFSVIGTSEGDNVSPFPKIEEEQDSKSGPSINTELLDYLKNFIVTFLGVPYSALNSLSENEYSRSVASTNILFAKDVIRSQNKTIALTNRLVRTYLLYSGQLKEKVKSLYVKKKNVSDEEFDSIYIGIVNSISITLPRPEAVINKATFESIEASARAGKEIIEGILSDELSFGDNDSNDIIRGARSMLFSKFMRSTVKTIGQTNTFGEIPDLKDLKPANVLNIKQFFTNLKEAVKGQEEAIKNAKEDSDSSSSGGGW